MPGEGAREVLSMRELKSKWLKLMVDMLGWGEEEDIWSWVGRVRGGIANAIPQVMKKRSPRCSKTVEFY